MKTTLLAFSISALLVSMCIVGSPAAWHPPATPHGITTAAGTEQAHADIAAGNIQLFEAGTRGVSAVGVPAGEPRLAKLPRHTLPCGCTTPNANLWVQYARAYNSVVVAHIFDGASR